MPNLTEPDYHHQFNQIGRNPLIFLNFLPHCHSHLPILYICFSFIITLIYFLLSHQRIFLNQLLKRTFPFKINCFFIYLFVFLVYLKEIFQCPWCLSSLKMANLERGPCSVISLTFNPSLTNFP